MDGPSIVIVSIVAFVVLVALMGIRQVAQSQCAIVERLGKYHKTLQPGISFIVPVFDRVRDVGLMNKEKGMSSKRIDMREQILDISKQEVITKDNIGMHIDTLIFYQVTDPRRTCYEIGSPVEAIRQLSRTTLRNVIGELELDTTLSARDTINQKLRKVLDEATDKWGIKVVRVEIQDIETPASLRETMQKQMVAERHRRATVTDAEARKQATILEAEGARENSVLRATGEREAAILAAEARRQEKILDAEGEKQAQILRAEGESMAIQEVQRAKALGLEAVRKVLSVRDGSSGVIALEAMRAQRDIATRLSQGENSKFFIPNEVAGLFGAIGGIQEALKLNKDPQGEPTEGSTQS